MTLRSGTLVSRILAQGMVGSDIEDAGQPVPLHPDEAVMATGWGEKRRRDFTLGRFCAHAALAQLGGWERVIARDVGGAPLWPAGFAGSITHTDGYAAAIAARKDMYLGVGVDAERSGGIGKKLLPRLFDAGERAWLAALEEEGRQTAATILFSAKEASFKALYPLSGEKPSFQDIHVEVSQSGFRATGGSQEISGLFAVSGDLVLTSAFLAAP